VEVVRPTFPDRIVRSQPAGAHGTHRRVEQRFPRCTNGRGAALRAMPRALAGSAPAVDDGEQRQARDARWFPHRHADGADLLVYKIYAESFGGADHLQRIVEEAHVIVNAALSGQVAE